MTLTGRLAGGLLDRLGGAFGPREKIRPYEHLSDPELDQLSGEAADLQLRLADLAQAEVEAKLLEKGCPPRSAYRQVRDPLLRGYAFRFYLDCEDAERGDPEARARVEHVISHWDRLRAAGAIQHPDEVPQDTV